MFKFMFFYRPGSKNWTLRYLDTTQWKVL